MRLSKIMSAALVLSVVATPLAAEATTVKRTKGIEKYLPGHRKYKICQRKYVAKSLVKKCYYRSYVPRRR